MAQVSYPGVYIDEVPSGVRAISGVSTSIAAFVDRFKRGPTDRAVEIFGIADFERIFGGLDVNSRSSYAITQFFLNGGSHAFVVRVLHGSASTARMQIGSGATGSALILVEAQEPGEWANGKLRIRIDPGAAAGTLDITITEYASDDPRPRVVSQERLIGIGPADLIGALDDSRVIAASGTTAVTPAINGLVWTLPALPAAGIRNETLGLRLIVPGAPNVEGTVRFTWTDAEAPTTLLALGGLIERGIRAQFSDVPALAGATVQVMHGQAILRVGRGGYHPGALITVTGGSARAALGFGTDAAPRGVSSPQEYAVGLPAGHGWTLSGGLVSSTPAAADSDINATDIIGSSASPKSGMQLLSDVDLFNILCLPKAAELPDGERRFVYDNAATFCMAERAFLLVDPPPAFDTYEEAARTTGGLRDIMTSSANAAIYFPRVKVPDPLADFELSTIAPSGSVAGIMARTDAERGVWVAPAGVDAVLRGVAELDVKLTDPENGVLNKLAINCVRGFPVQGRIVWGARTLEGADNDSSEWKYVPVRRLALFIEESLYRGTRWAVFQPNDEPLWARLRQNVGAFMHRLFRQRAFQGSTPRDAYFVKCDAELNPPEDRELGIVTVEVGFAPLKPAEFVVIRIQQIAEIA